MLSKLKSLIHAATAPESNSGSNPESKYSTSVRTEPVVLPLELAFVPRFPPKPVDCSDELFEEVMDRVRVALKGNLPDGKIIYYPRQRELYIQFPEEQVHCF